MSSSGDTSTLAPYLLWILKRLELRLRLWASLPEQELHSLFLSLTAAEKIEASGLLSEMSAQLGYLYAEYVRAVKSENASKTDCTILPFSTGQSELK